MKPTTKLEPDLQPRFDCLAVNLKTYKVRVLARNKTQPRAEAFCVMAVLRRGVVEEFFPVTPARQYKDGDLFP